LEITQVNQRKKIPFSVVPQPPLIEEVETTPTSLNVTIQRHIQLFCTHHAMPVLTKVEVAEVGRVGAKTSGNGKRENATVVRF
jgi:hypothetical protein